MTPTRTSWEERDFQNSQRAFRAVREMNQMLSMFQSVARALTGVPDLEVRLTDGAPRTDGKIVYLRPAIELGDVIAHERANCSRRDEKSHPVCPACRQREIILRTFYHELAHITADSFQTIQYEDKADMLARVLNEHPGASGTRLAKIQKAVNHVNSLPRYQVNYMGMASLVSPFLPTIINTLEDARVNKSMYKVRAGTFHMFRSKIIDVFENGVTNLDGTVFHWANEDENAQAMIGCLVIASEVEPELGYVSDPVLIALQDKELRDELAVAADASTAADIYRASFRVLEHLRRLGFCRAPEDAQDDPPPPPPPEPQPEQENDEQEPDDSTDPGESEESTPGEGGQSKSANDDESSDDESDESEDDEPDNGGSSDNDELDDDDDETDESETGESASGSDDESTDWEADDEDESSGSGGTDDQDDTENEQSGEGVSSEMDETDDADDQDDLDSESDDQGPESGVDEAAASERMLASDPNAVANLVKVFGGHDLDEPPNQRESKLLAVAINQAEQFDEASNSVNQINVHRFDQLNTRSSQLAWRIQYPGYDPDDFGKPDDFQMPESLVSPALLKMRVIFSDNKKSRASGEKRSGKIVSHRLASVMTGNAKVFAKPTKPNRKDYFVMLALDVSGSTQMGGRLENIKKMGFAFGNLLNRAGVKFAIYAHTGSPVKSNDSGIEKFEADVFIIKEENDPWDDKAQHRLAVMNGSGNNLDGHALEFFRKRCDRSTATDRIILYVTDGKMPEANKNDERAVLVREIAECDKRGYALVGVGIGTDSPRTHGLDTIRIDRADDIHKLIADLEKRLAVKL